MRPVPRSPLQVVRREKDRPQAALRGTQGEAIADEDPEFLRQKVLGDARNATRRGG